MKPYALLLIIFLLGCAAPPAPPSAGQLWQQEASGTEVKYRWQMDTNPALAPLRGKVALFSPKDITFAMLANQDHPNAEERAAILELARIRESYHAEQRASDEKYRNPFRRISEAQSQAVSAVWADLYNRTITFGESARKRQEIDAASEESRQRLRNALASEALTVEQLALQRFNSFLLRQQILKSQQSTPTLPQIGQGTTLRLQTTCTTIGNTLFCQ
jgi:hypothetical protein